MGVPPQSADVMRDEREGLAMSALRSEADIGLAFSTSALGSEFNQSTQHSNLLAEMECGHEAATSDLLFCGPTV